MSDAQMWALIVGFLAPPVIAVAQQPSWPDWLRSLVTVAFSVVAGTGTVWLTGNFEPADLVSSVLLILVTSIAAYKGVWKPTTIAPKIEAATS